MIRAALVDLDGTVYRGDDLIPGAATAIEAVRDRGLDVLFCSNNPTKTPAEYASRLDGMGIDADPAAILPASTVTRQYLQRHHDDESIYLLGVDSLDAYLREGGLHLVDDPVAASVYVASWSDRFDFGDMRDALRGVDRETGFVATDPDRTIPTDQGPLPGSGAVYGAIARTVGREPDAVLGKPAKLTGELALDRLDVDPDDCVVIGDRLDTDLALGDAFGMTTVLVETGVDDRSSADGDEVTPDHVVDSLGEVPDLLSTPDDQ